MDSTASRHDARHGQLSALYLAESDDDLVALGFGATTHIGNTRLLGGSPALTASLAGIDELDGLALAPWQPNAAVLANPANPANPANGVVSIDHVVVTTPNPNRTQEAFESQGLEARRVRRIETSKGMRRQTFFWMGDVICEVGGPDDGDSDDPATWWGLALTVSNVDATAAFYGNDASEVKDAVQPGRRVCTLRSARSTTPILFISPHVAP